jgi:hypothetical protein
MKVEYKKDTFSILFHLIFGLILFLYTLQPWSIRFGQIPLQVLLVWLLFFCLLVNKSHLIVNIPKIYGPLILILFLIFIVSVSYRIIIDGTGFLRLFQLLTGLAISVEAALLIADKKNRKYFLYPFVFAATLSSLVAVMQSFGWLRFTWSRTLYYLSSTKVPSGLESYPVAFGYSVIGIGVLIICLFIYDFRNKEKSLNILRPSIAIVCSIIIFAGIYVSESRSGVGGVLIGLITAVILLKATRRKFINLSTIIWFGVLLALLTVATPSALLKIQNKVDQIKIDKRLTGGTWTIFLPVIIQFPLGVPNIEKQKNSSQISYQEITYTSAIRANKGYDPHNCILTTMVYYGIPAGFALLLLYLSIIFKGIKVAFLILRKSHYENPNTIVFLFFVCANVSLIFHSWFHNANMVTGEMRSWFWIGSVFSLAYLNNKEIQC